MLAKTFTRSWSDAQRAEPSTRRATLCALLVTGLTLVVAPSPAHADARSDAKAQVEFGILVAQRGLWREARYRWEHAVKLDPSYAAAWNNLGIAYERAGLFGDAREAYQKALELQPDNSMIQLNYDLFKEIGDHAGQNPR